MNRFVTLLLLFSAGGFILATGLQDRKIGFVPACATVEDGEVNACGCGEQSCALSAMVATQDHIGLPVALAGEVAQGEDASVVTGHGYDGQVHIKRTYIPDQQTDVANQMLRQLYFEELARFEDAGPTRVSLGEYETLSMLYCQSEGYSSSACACRWDLVEKYAADQGQVGSAFAYMTSVNPNVHSRALMGSSSAAAISMFPRFDAEQRMCLQ